MTRADESTGSTHEHPENDYPGYLAKRLAEYHGADMLTFFANGSIGYIPNRSAYPEGLYEVVSARCVEGSGELLVKEALQMLNELTKP